MNKMLRNDIRDYVGAPQRRRRDDMLLTSGDNMPANAPYPGESEEEFLIRMAAEQGGGRVPSPYANTDPASAAAMGQPLTPDPRSRAVDPRAAALAQMMGNPATNPANTFNIGRTTENYLDPQQSNPLPPPGTSPIEQMSQDEGDDTGGDAFMADAYGAGYDSYANGLPGSEGPPTRMQMRNRMVMNPNASEDEIEQDHMLGIHDLNVQTPGRYGGRDTDNPDARFQRYDVDSLDRIGPDGKGVKRNEDDDFEDEEDRQNAALSTEDELEMVQGAINKKTGDDADGLTGDEDADLETIRSLEVDLGPGGDTSDWARLVDAFKRRYGYDPTDADSERDNED